MRREEAVRLLRCSVCSKEKTMGTSCLNDPKLPLVVIDNVATRVVCVCCGRIENVLVYSSTIWGVIGVSETPRP